MSALPRVLGALALAGCMVVPALPAAAAPTPAHGVATVSSDDRVTTPSGKKATVVMAATDPDVAAPPIAADAWVLADLDTGEILAEQNPDLAVRPASTLKLLTALTVAPRLAPEQPYRAVKADETAEGNRVVLYEGLEYTVADLLHAALLPSANDAAEALARANGGVGLTVKQMNAEAQRLGATHTTVKTPSGLDEEGQATTATDMALIGRAAFANPEIAAYLKLTEVDFPGKMEKGKRVVYPIYNHNRMLTHKNFTGAMGGKSGYTSKAGNTLVAAAERDGRRLLVTLFHIGGSTYRTGETLLNWGFANADSLQPVGKLAAASAPAPTFDRTIIPLPKKGKTPTTREAYQASVSDAPTATAGASGFALPSIPGIPSPLTLLTLVMAVLVVLRARVYWIDHRHRTAWVELDGWARQQAAAARRQAFAGSRGSSRPRRSDVDLRRRDQQPVADPDADLISTR